MIGFQCEVCGKSFDRKSTSHLRTHGFKSWIEYEEYVRKKAAPPPPVDLVSKVANMILIGEEVPPEYLVSLDNLQRSVAARANALMDVATMKRVNRLGRLLDAMDRTDEKLVDENMVNTLTFQELLKLNEHLRVHAKEIYDEMKPVEVKDNKPTSVVNVQQVMQPPAVTLPSDPRERSSLLNQVKRLLSAASGEQVGSNGNGRLALEHAR